MPRKKTSTAKVEASPQPGAEAQPPVTGALSIPVVGIGASAGGLEAFTEFLRALPADTGMAFVLVQHLAPGHQSMLAEILGRSAHMPISEARDGERVAPDHVYVIPPGTDLIVRGGVLELTERTASPGQHRPIDHFLRSLAEDKGHKAIGVVLSGSASDGTLGLEEIKAAGGVTFAQDHTAQHESMPHSAIAAGCVDFVLPPDEIAKEIGRIARSPYVAPGDDREAGEEPNLDLSPVFDILQHVMGVDFTHYKRNTLVRRITRRMLLQKIEGLDEYVKLLRSNAAEVEALYQDVLIGVTSFFRNPVAFDVLKAKVFPALTRDRSRHDPVRLWVLGCSTGEEAYSLAIAYAEHAEESGHHIPLQIFATDLNGACIDKARAGVYSRHIAQDVSPERLRRFFVEVEGAYRLHTSIRESCIFARHNLLAEPPFSRIDMVSCRNLLIYLGNSVQQAVIPILHYALRPKGFLWLGNSETIGSYRDLFELHDPKQKVYVKKPAASRVAFGSLIRRPPGDTREHAGTPEHARDFVLSAVDTQKEADRLLLLKYAPASVLVNSDFDILQFRGDTGPYLAPAPGKASLNLLKMLREGLLVGVRASVHQARKDEAPVRQEGLRVKSSGGYLDVNVEVVPIGAESAAHRCYMVVFEKAAGTGTVTEEQALRESTRAELSDQETRRLQQELAATREYLQSVIEQQEAANEELQSANEEVQSANEELQSINEELETSKEEVQSSNEELATVNEELNTRNHELGQTNDDLVNLLTSVQMAIVMLGPDLRIRRFTPTAEKMLNLIPADIGRPIKDLNLKVTVPDLEKHLEDVIETVMTKEFEVDDSAGRHYSLRLRPYRTVENRIDGALMMLVDIDTLKRNAEQLRRQADLLEQVREPILVWQLGGAITYWNAGAQETYGYTREEALGRSPQELLATEPSPESFLPALQKTGAWNGDLVHTRRDGQKIFVESRMVMVRLESGEDQVVEANRPVTERREMEALLRRRADDLVAADRSKDEFLAMLAHELRNPLAPLRNVAELLRRQGVGGGASEPVLDMLDRQVHTMARLIDDLLDVSRITLSKMELRRQPVNIASVVTHAAETSQPLFEARRQTLSVTVPGQPLYVMADPVRLEQVLDNLLNNASKYTGIRGRIELTAEHVPGADPSAGAGQLVVRVKDNGMGIDADSLPHVFNLFMRAGRSIDQSQGGLGLGLTLVRRLVEMHGGTVEAHSEGRDQGSEFTVRLPTLAQEGEVRPLAPAHSRKPATRPRRVLVVDDNVDAAQSTAMLLGMESHVVKVAHDGPSAIAAAETFDPDAVLMDIGMPGMDGYQTARELRRLPALQRAVLIAATGFGHDEARRLGLEAGFSHFMVKPIDLRAVAEILDSLP
jgi:two-component system CheB/CheR fusion protein